MTETAFTRRLHESNKLEEMWERELPQYFPESHLDLADHVFYRDDMELFVTVREYSTPAEVRLFEDDSEMTNGRTLYSMSRDTGNNIEDVCRFLTSKYLHNPTLNFACSLMGYNPETHMCYALENSGIETYCPENRGSYAFQSCRLSSVWNPKFEFEPDLRAILEPPEDSASQKYAYVFTEAVIEVDVHRETNWITPLVYDTAWKDYLEKTSGKIIRAEGEYSTELVSQQI